MAGRRKAVASKRVDRDDEGDGVAFDSAQYEAALASFRPSPKLTYPALSHFMNTLSTHYRRAAASDLPELEAIVGRRIITRGGVLPRAFFVELLNTWTLYYVRDVRGNRELVVALVNAAAALNNTGLRVQPSTIPQAGYGLFATRAFAAHERITDYGGYYCSVDAFEVLDLPDSERQYLLSVPDNMGGGIRDAQVCFRLGQEMGRWANHARDARINAYVEAERAPDGSGPPRMYLRALEGIEAGSEIFFYYGRLMEFEQPEQPDAVECRICLRLNALTMCGACETPVCGMPCQKRHVCK